MRRNGNRDAGAGAITAWGDTDDPMLAEFKGRAGIAPASPFPARHRVGPAGWGGSFHSRSIPRSPACRGGHEDARRALRA